MTPNLRRARINVRLIAILLLASATLVGLLAGGYYGRKWYTTHRALREGREALARGDWATASRQLGIYLSKYPESDPSVLSDYARSNLAVRPRTGEALMATASAYRILLRLHPDAPETFERLVRIYGQLGDTSNALQIAGRWLSVDPRSAKARLWIARSRIAQKDYARAESELTELVKVHPEQVEAYSLLAAIAAREGAGADGRAAARRWIDEAVVNNPNSAEALIARASMARLQPTTGTQSGAAIRADLQAAAGTNPSDPYLWLALSNEWLGIGDLEQARRSLQSAKAAHDRAEPNELDDPEGWTTALFLQEAAIPLAERDAAAAVALAEAALAEVRQPNSRRAILPVAGRSFLLARNVPRAVTCIDELERLVPPDRRTAEFSRELEFLRAASVAGADDPLAAATRLEALVARAPDDLASWRLLAATLSYADQPRRAARAWRQCLRLAPDDADVRIALARELNRASDWMGLGSLIQTIPEASRTAEIAVLGLKAELGQRAPNGLTPMEASTLRTQADALNARFPGRLDLYLARAMLEESAGDVAAAERILRTAIKDCDGDAQAANLELARFFLRHERYDDAVALSDSLCERFGSDPQPWIIAADVAAARRKPEVEREVLTRGLQTVSDSAGKRKIELRCVSAEIRQGKITEAADRLERLVDSQRVDLAASIALVNVRISQKSWDRAQKAVDRIRTDEGDAGTTWKFQQARVWYEMDWRGHATKLGDLLGAVIAVDPEAVEAVALLGQLYERQGDWKRAEETYRKGLAASNGSELLAARLMDVLETVGRGAELQGVLDLVRADAVDRDMFRLRAALNSRDLTEAIRQVQTQIDRDLKNWRARVLCARLTYQLPEKDPKKTLALLDEADRIGGTPLESVFLRIAVLVDQGRNEEALRFLNQLVATEESFDHLLLRAAFFAQVGQFEKAAADYQRLPGLAKGAEGDLALARFQIGMNQFAEALATVEDGLKRAPGDSALLRMKILALVRRARPDDREAALALIDSLEKAAGEDVELLSFRATIALASGPKFRDQAESLLERIVTLMPRRSEAHAQLAYLALERGDLPRARERVARGVAVNADDPALAMARARIELVARKPELAIEFARAATRTRPNDAEARRLFVECAVSGGAKLAESALDEVNRWVREAPKDASARLAQSDLRAAAGETPAAIAGLESFLAEPENAGDVGVRLAVIRLLRRQSLFARADAHLEHLERLAPEMPEVLFERLRCLAAAKRFDELAVRLSQLDPQQSTPALILGANLLAENAATAPQAIALLEAAESKAPNGPDILFALAEIQFRLGNSEKASAAYERILKELPTHGEALNNLAYIVSEHRHDYARALGLADRALAADDRNPHFHDTRAAILEKIPGRGADAVAEYEKAAQLAATDPATAATEWLRGARVLVNSDPRGAAARAQNALRIDRESPVLDDAQRAEIGAILKASEN